MPEVDPKILEMHGSHVARQKELAGIKRVRDEDIPTQITRVENVHQRLFRSVSAVGAVYRGLVKQIGPDRALAAIEGMALTHNGGPLDGE
jgi:hypothetical protein